MKKLKKYITNPKESFTKKYGRIKRRLEMQSIFIKNRINGNYTSKKINLSWDGKPFRYDLVNKVIKESGYKNYLEIGCFKDVCFNKIVCENKIGVDPLMGGTLRMTSDDFFATNKQKFDCIFIDGLHIYDQVKKDILNAIDALAEGGTILIDDCLPLRFTHQTVPPESVVWSGDVWKAIVEMRSSDNIETAVCLIDHGIGVIKKRTNKNKLELNVKDFKSLKYADLVDNYEKWMNTTPFEKIMDFIK